MREICKMGERSALDRRPRGARKPPSGFQVDGLRACGRGKAGHSEYQPVRRPPDRRVGLDAARSVICGVAQFDAGEIGSCGDLEFGELFSEVVVDRAGAEKELRADLRVGQSASGKVTYAQLRGAERARRTPAT